MSEKKCKVCGGDISYLERADEHYFYSDCVKQLKSTNKAQADLIRELREDAERWHRQQAHPCLDFLTCCEMENRHNQLMAKIDKIENSND